MGKGDIMAKLLSIIIPCYNAEPWINMLLDTLAPQVTNEVEVIVIDDGSEKPFETDYPWVRLIRQKNGGVSSARNKGLDNCTGDYISFIDADDLVAPNYISSILFRIKTEHFDYLYMSWKTLPEGQQMEVKLNTVLDNFPPYNLCVWNRVYKKNVIGKTRFNTLKAVAEDAEFVREIHEFKYKKSFIPDFMYFYRTTTPNSLTKRFQEGQLRTQRVVYYFPQVTPNMTYLIEEFKRTNKYAEVVLMTNKNMIPELTKYALIMQPSNCHGTELRGYPTHFFKKVTMPVEADIVIWTERTFAIGGIETFIFNFCKQMSKYYDIVVLYSQIDNTQRMRLEEYARVIRQDNGMRIDCDTLIINRITDTAPFNVIFKRKVQMVHSCKWMDGLTVPQDNDYMVAVSHAVARSYADFKPDHKVIHNLTCPSNTEKALILVSATRTGTNEKGQKRMIALSNLLDRKGIPFVWFCFCDNPIQGADKICFVKPTLNIKPYIASASYLVQLSDHEGFCYSLVEALELGTPCLVTDLEVLPELGFEDGVTGYKVPWVITDDFDAEKIYTNQLKGTFEYYFDNDLRIGQWREILGEGHPIEREEYIEAVLTLKATITFYDIVDKVNISKGDIFVRKASRAYELMQKSFAEMVV